MFCLFHAFLALFGPLFNAKNTIFSPIREKISQKSLAKKSEYSHVIPLVPCWWFSITNALVGSILTSRRGRPIRALRRRQHFHHQHDNLNLTWKHAPDSRQATGPWSCAATSRRNRRRASILSLSGLRFKDKSESSLWPGAVITFVASCSDEFIYCK